MSENFPGELSLLAELHDRQLKGRTSMTVDARECAALMAEGLVESAEVRGIGTFRLTKIGEERLAVLRMEIGA
jgi:hypothetical protein